MRRPSHVPQESTARFVSPYTPSIGKSPSIKEVMAEPVSRKEPEKAVAQPQSTPAPQQEVNEEVEKNEEVVETKPQVAPTGQEEQDEYLRQWNAMLDVVFTKVYSVHSPLYNMPPAIENHVMKIKVGSSIQQKNIEQKKRDMLEFFRNNYREDLDDIEVEVDAAVETKKVIYANEDKLDYLREQNREMDDFMRILNLKLV